MFNKKISLLLLTLSAANALNISFEKLNPRVNDLKSTYPIEKIVILQISKDNTPPPNGMPLEALSENLQAYSQQTNGHPSQINLNYLKKLSLYKRSNNCRTYRRWISF